MSFTVIVSHINTARGTKSDVQDAGILWKHHVLELGSTGTCRYTL